MCPPWLKFIYSEKASRFCEIFTLLLTAVHTVKSKGKISQNFVAFSEYMNFRIGLTDLPNIRGASGPPGPPGSASLLSMYKTLVRPVEDK